MIQMLRRQYDKEERAVVEEFVAWCHRQEHFIDAHQGEKKWQERIEEFMEERKPHCTCNAKKGIADPNCPVHEYLD